MTKLFLAINRQWREAILAAGLGALCLQLHLANAPAMPSTSEMVLRAEQGRSDMSLRNPGFPNTFISSIHVDLTSPNHWLRLSWSGPQASHPEAGPFHSSPGGGLGTNDCNDISESNRGGSKCTPKGTRRVEGFSDTMSTVRNCKFVTWFHSSREIALHSYPYVPRYPASSGCIRLSEHAAQLIHNNSLVGKTEVIVDGTWTNPALHQR
jgi:L,D-transpeptidase catalytic domain